MIVTFQSDEIDLIWPRIELMITRVLDRGSYYTLWEIYEGLKSERFQLWTHCDGCIDAVLITAIQTDTSKYCLYALLYGKDIDKWRFDLQNIVETWAKAIGCKEMRLCGRKGWLKFGFKLNEVTEYGHVMSKAL